MAKSQVRDIYCNGASEDGRSISVLVQCEGGTLPPLTIEAHHVLKKSRRIAVLEIEDGVPAPEGWHEVTLAFTEAVTPLDLLARRVGLRARVEGTDRQLRLSADVAKQLIHRMEKSTSDEATEVFFSPDRNSPIHRIVNRLRKKDFSASPETDLCRMMLSRGSDKSNGWHNYTILYDEMFRDLRGKTFNLLEVGIGTNNVDVPSNMGADGVPGASLRGWRDYFQNARIFGADVDERILFSEERIETFHVDQRDGGSIRRMWDSLPDEKFGIIIDDGLHEYEANRNLLIESLYHLEDGGFYIIEDIFTDPENMEKFRDLVCSLHIPAAIIKLPSRINHNDNCVAILQP